MRHVCVLTPETLSEVPLRFRARTVIPALLLALACVFAGCASDDDADADNNGAGGTDGSGAAGTGATAGNNGAAGVEPAPDGGGESGDDGISLTWKVKAASDKINPDWAFEPGLEGVEVCLIENVDIPCVHTDEEGNFTLPGVPRHSELLLTFSKEGYIPYLVSVKTGTENIDVPGGTQPIMIQKDRTYEAYDALGVVLDEAKGHIFFGTTDETVGHGIPGRLSISIEPAAGGGPLFLDNELRPVPEATELSEEVICAIFANLDEGEYVISWKVEGPVEMSCNILGIESNMAVWGLPAEQLDAIRVNVRPGFFSGLNTVFCTAVAGPAANAG